MTKLRLREVLQAVDPSLTIVSGHRRTRKPKERDWVQAGGAICPRCGEEAVRFRPQDGVCLACARALNEKEDADKKKRDKFQKFRKRHNARVDKTKGRAG